MYVVFNMGIIYYGVFQMKSRYVIEEIYLFLIHIFHVCKQLVAYINTFSVCIMFL